MDWVLIWIVVGLALILVEFFVSGFVVIFFGVAALVTGIALWAGMSAEYGIPFVVFAIVSVALLVLLRSRFKDLFTGRTLSADADDDFIGHEAVVDSGFDESSTGRGKVSYRGAAWDARADEGSIDKGSVVRIVARHGVVLEVEPINRNNGR